jgi:hypothetical protein
MIVNLNFDIGKIACRMLLTAAKIQKAAIMRLKQGKMVIQKN